MQIGRIDDLHTVSCITGPSHVWLGLVFSDIPKSAPELVERPAIGNCHYGRLDVARILAAVREGIADANVGLFPDRIEYVANDSPRYDLYRHCAESLAKHAGARPRN
jgi:hypothetical protein